MIKYFLIALVFHSFLFLNFHRYNTLGNPNVSVKRNIPISYNVVSKETKIDGIQKIKAQTEKTSEKFEEKPEKKEIKEVSNIEPEIKSKMSNNKEKLKETKKVKETKKEIKQEKKTLNKENKNQKESSEKQNSENIFTKSGNFTVNSDGSYTAISSKGIDFEIINEVTPDYPRQAEIAGFKQIVIIEAKFLVDLNGNVENIQIIKSYGKFGFDKEVIKALKKWRFKPITYQGKKIKVYFNKEFVFAPKS